MSHRILAVALAATLAGCANGVSTATIDHSVIPQDAGGTQILSPEGAIGYAAYSLGHPSSTLNRPGNAALAVAAVDYLAGDFYTDPRFVGIPAEDKIRMLQGRDEERQALGIAPGATSQQVVDGLIAAYPFYQANDFAGAAKVLPVSVFTLGAAGTTRVLSHLPPLVSANAAAQNANAFENSGCLNGNGGGCF